MEEKKVVVDASIIAKWFLIEEYSEQALRLRNDYISGKIILAVPSLLFYEVLNALKYSGVYSSEELLLIGTSLEKYGFEIYELRENLLHRTIKYSMEHNTTIYDASYIALADTLSTILYTADNELLEKFPKIARHIKDYK